MSRYLVVLVLLAAGVSAYAQAPSFFQKCYGQGTLLLASASASSTASVEIAVRNILHPATETVDGQIAGKLVFRIPGLSTAARPPLTIIMQNAEKYVMENPWTATFAGPAILYRGVERAGVKGTLEVTVADLRDPTDALGPSIMLFDTIRLTFVPSTSPLPYQLEWKGIVWRGDLVVFERWGR